MKPGPIRSEPAHAREPYARPELVAIELKAEQVLSVGCKTASATAFGGFPACGSARPCSAVGS